MKTLLSLALALIGSVASAQIVPVPPGGGNSYSGYLYNSTASLNTAPVIDMAQYKASKVSAQVIYSSVTFAAATFTDGSESTGSVTVSSFSAICGNILTIGSKSFKGGTDFACITSNNATATAIASTITAAGLSIAAVARANIVYATSTLNGTAYNYTVVSSTPTALTVKAPGAMTGGTNPAFALGGSRITVVSGFPVGLPVLYTANSASIGGLTDQTTYYAMPFSAGVLGVSTTSALALASYPVVFTSTSSQVVADAPKFTALPWTVGNATYTWQSSNDNVSWATAVVSTGAASVGFGAAGAVDTLYDFGSYNPRYLRFNFTAPATGGVLLQVPVNIKQDGIGPF